MARKSGRERFEERLAAQHAKLLTLGTEDHYLDTALYDFEYGERTDDVEWYRRLVSERNTEAGLVVELGAGTGRVTLPLLGDGHRVAAIDRMPSMLSALRSRLYGRHRDLAEIIEGDMRQLPLPDASARLVIAPFNGLMHLYTWQDLKRCFDEVHRILVPSGVFAFDVQLPDLDWLMWNPDERHAVTPFVHPTTKERLIYSTNHEYDAATQVCHIRIFYDDAPPRGKKFVPPATPKRLVHLAHRQIFPEELRLLVAASGLQLESLTADFEDTPLSGNTESQVAVCTRPPHRSEV